ncbi:MAG TPA: hypothetical protein ENJ34_03635 [Epsilonproteobacteria bacterium]|nr:hypothetical protein [Campylobacterota bacterium]
MKDTTLIKALLLFTFSLSYLLAAELIEVKENSLYPEGISYDKKSNNFLISSISKGEIWSVNSSGESTLFTKDTTFPSTLGILVDEKQNRLLVCIADPGVGKNSSRNTKGKLAAIAVYDLTSKEKINYFNLGALHPNIPHLANDLTVDSKGNIYITDSFSPMIYKIDIKGNISIFTEDINWSIKEGEFGLNGIVYHPDGYLIVAHYASHSLYKILLKNPNIHHKILFDQKDLNLNQQIISIDGLALTNKNTLSIVSNNFSPEVKGNGVYKLQSSDDWESATITELMETGATFPTTLTKKGSSLYVIHAKLPILFSGNKKPPETFEIQKVIYEKVHHVKK